MQKLEDKEYLFCGLGDGHLLSYNLTDDTKNSEVIGN